MFWLNVDANDLNRVETTLIRILRPSLNGNPPCTFSSQRIKEIWLALCAPGDKIVYGLSGNHLGGSSGHAMPGLASLDRLEHVAHVLILQSRPVASLPLQASHVTILRETMLSIAAVPIDGSWSAAEATTGMVAVSESPKWPVGQAEASPSWKWSFSSR
jgi:hypothetical protein